MSNNKEQDPRIEKILKLKQHSSDAFLKARRSSEKAIRYVNNIQWTATDREHCKNLKKPYLTYNIIIPIFAALKGNEELMRRRAKIKPVNNKETEMSDVLQGRWNALVDEEDYNEKRLLVFIDGLATRMGGYMERSVKMNELGYLDYTYEVANNMRVYLDPETTKYDLSDCNWMIKEGWYTLQHIKEKWGVDPNILKDESKLRFWDKLVEAVKRFTESSYSTDAHYEKHNDTYRVYELQERVSRPSYILFNGHEYSYAFKDEYNLDKKAYKGWKIIKEDMRTRIKITTVAPAFDFAVFVDEFSDLPTTNFDLFGYWGYNFNVQKSETTSLGELLFDPQDDLNVSMSQIREFVTKSISSAMFVYKDKKLSADLRKHGNAAGNVYDTKFKDGVPQRSTPENLSPEILLSSQTALELIGAISGVAGPILGQEGKSSESGKLRQMKIERAVAAINDFFHNLWLMDMLIVKDYVDLFSYVYSEKDRPIRIKQARGQFDEQILNLEMGGEILHNVENLSMYVEIDQGEDSVTVQEDAFEKWLALANVIAGVNPALIDVKTLVEQAPIPQVDKWIAHIDKVLQSQGIDTIRQQNLEQVKATLENVKIERDMISDEEKIKIERIKAEKEKSSGAEQKKTA